MNRFLDLVAAIAFALSMAACQTNPYPDRTAATQPDDKMNSVLESGGGSGPRGSGAIGGATGSAAVRQSP